MKTVLRNTLAVAAIIVIISFATNYSGLIKEQVGVKGASTDRAQEISQEIGSDINEHVNDAKEQALQVNVKDVIDFFGRFQKIPEDVTNAKEYVQDQVSSVLESRNENK